MSPQTATVVRPVGRRKATASKTAEVQGKDAIKKLLDMDEASHDEEVKPPADPALLAASIMIRSGIGAAGLSKSDVCAPGAILLVVPPRQEWVKLIRKAWATDISGPTKTSDTLRLPDSWTRSPETIIFACNSEPDRHERQPAADNFAQAVALRIRFVGISANPVWLPPDLVAAADHRIELTPFSPEDLAELVLRVAGHPPTSSIAADEARAVTPRLARLAVRPNQSANEYLDKLRQLIDAERAARRSATPVQRASPRAEPTLERLHGLDEAVAWGLQLRDDLEAFRSGRRDWSDVDRGLLLSGPPGTGKTLFARALATSCGVLLLTGSYGAWIGTGLGHQGDLLRSMRKCFKDAKDNAPSIVFIDEIDSFTDRSRVQHYPEWHTEIVNTLLAELDGVEDREGVVVLGACNNPQRLDPALVRSGRLDRHLRIGLPSTRALATILREHLAGDLPGEPLESLGLLLLGSTGADVERLVRGARRRARLAGRRMQIDDVVAEIGGREERSPHDLSVVAIHEAGHAVAAIELGLFLEGVSIRGSGRVGLTRVEEPALFLTVHDVYDRLVSLLSGRAAEAVILKTITSGAGGKSGSDLHRATYLAAMSAAELGLEADYGLTWTPLPERETEFSEMLAADPRLALLVRTRLDSAYESAVDLMRRSAGTVRIVADTLLERGALDGDEVRRLVANAGVRP